MTKLLPTSTAGSLPKPSWLAEPEKLWSPWKLQNEELIAGKKDALSLSLFDQLRAGIDIVSDGEQTRQHFVTTFIEHLSGVDLKNAKSLKSVIAMMRAFRPSWAPSSVKNPFLSKMRVFYVSSPASRLSGRCRGP